MPSMIEMGFFRSCETVLTNSFFIRSRFLRSVMSRRTAATPTGSPYGVTTETRLAWAVRPSESGSSIVLARLCSNRSRRASWPGMSVRRRPTMASGASPSMGPTAGFASRTTPSSFTMTTASEVLPSTAASVLRSSASAW